MLGVGPAAYMLVCNYVVGARQMALYRLLDQCVMYVVYRRRNSDCSFNLCLVWLHDCMGGLCDT